MKKVLSLVLCLALGLFLAVGCGETKQEPVAPEKEKVQTEAPVKEPTAPEEKTPEGEVAPEQEQAPEKDAATDDQNTAEETEQDQPTAGEKEEVKN